jgi:hypothetical protein
MFTNRTYSFLLPHGNNGKYGITDDWTNNEGKLSEKLKQSSKIMTTSDVTMVFTNVSMRLRYIFCHIDLFK